jgi:hypothetical protein
VADAAGPTEEDAGHVLSLLAKARGYEVVARDGKRIGSFIEVTGQGGAREARIAIRHEGIFLWRRRLLPLAVVARLVPERRIVVLNVDKRALAQAAEASLTHETSSVSEEHPTESTEWPRLIEHYASPAAGEGEQSDAPEHATADGPSVDGAPEERPIETDAERPEQAEHHLRFVPTKNGYVLVEQEGPAPPLGREVEASEPGTFVVAKLGPSPLPSDARVCAYLERVE